MSLSASASFSVRLPRFSLFGVFVAVMVVLAAPCRGQTDVWTDTSGGNWGTGGDWSLGIPNTVLPTNITTAGTYTVTINSAETVGTLTLNDANATLSITSGGALTLGALSAVSSFSAGSVTLNGGSILASLVNTLNNNGSIQATGGTNTIAGTGIGSLVFTNTDLVGSSGGATLTIGNQLTDVVTNASVMTANGGTINFGAGQSTWFNTGTLTATNSGVLNLGNNTSSWSGLGGGAITANSGGIVNFDGQLTTATLNLSTISIGGGGGTHLCDLKQKDNLSLVCPGFDI